LTYALSPDHKPISTDVGLKLDTDISNKSRRLTKSVERHV